MGIARTRPSRIVREVELSVPDLPAAAIESNTVAIPRLPTRGIVHNLTFFLRDNATLSANNAFIGMLHTTGLATVIGAGASAAGLTTLSHLTSSILVTKFDVKSTTGNLQTGTVSAVTQFIAWYTMFNQSGNHDMGPIGYDISDAVLGPDANDGTLYFSLIGGSAFDFTTLLSAKIRIEIEPCY